MADHSRRSFLLSGVGGTVAAPALFRHHAPDEDYWGMVRRQFAFDDAKVPMNAANLCPSPRSVADRVAQLTRDVDRDCSFQNRRKFSQLREAAREAVAELVGADPSEIALVRNTSEANNVISNGLPLTAGDEVVVWDANHPTNRVAWDVRAARFGFAVRTVALPPEAIATDRVVERFTRAFTAKTKVLAITHVSNGTGLRLPVRELCDAAHRHDIHVHVDGAQTLGALALDLHALACDSFTASAHKWPCGPKEIGILYVRSERVDAIWPNVVGLGWGNSAKTTARGARKFETLGQRDDACVAALGTAIEFQRAIGPDRIEARIHELTDWLKRGVTDAGVKLVTPAAWEHSGGVCIMQVPRANRQRIQAELYREHGVAGAATGGLRLCPHIYNTRSHIERALEAVRSMRELFV